MLTVNERAAEIMEHLCNDDSHGYSQPNRQGVGTGGTPFEKITLSDGSTVNIAYGDRDCSSAVIECYAAQGIDCGGAYSTRDMRECMVNSGNFKWEPQGNGYYAKPGDIYLKEGVHAAMCIDDNPDMMGEFAASENGTITGTRGDQTKNEGRIVKYRNDGWDGKLVYVGGDSVSNSSNGNSVSLEEIAREVIDGKWGNYPERKEKLESAGYNYNDVQSLVNSLLAK